MFLFESAVRGFSKDHPVTAPLFLGTGHRISRTPRYGTLLFYLDPPESAVMFSMNEKSQV